MTQDKLLEQGPVAWYDPSNGVVSTDRDSPLFTPLGQVWALSPKREWVGLTDEEFHEACWESYVDPVTGECSTGDREYAVRWTETKLKEKNT
jgi:hypothetical protein